MIVKFQGAVNGIVEYLLNGQKKDNFLTRDELDKRVTLMGDINVLDHHLKNMQTNGDKYFRIVLSFKEDYIDTEILQKITKDFKDFYWSGFTDKEIYCYAEAHLPKIKSLIMNNGEEVIRKPHVHIVIPKQNMQTGDSVNMYTPKNIKYIDAFQEFINHKYKLESPKDNSNVKKYADIIARHKNDLFLNEKSFIIKNILEKNITNQDNLLQFLKENDYQPVVKNTKKYEYISIFKNNQEIKLNNLIFKEKFLSLGLEKKNKIIDNIKNSIYSTNAIPKKSVAEYQKLLKEYNFVALSDRYVPRLSKKQRKDYYSLTKENKELYLKERALYCQKLDAKKQKYQNEKLIIIPDKKQEKTSESALFLTHIKEKIQAENLLNYLENSHNLVARNYELTKSKDGQDRISKDKRNYNLVDFCLKEMNFSWEETIKILKNVYNLQEANILLKKKADFKVEYLEWKQSQKNTKENIKEQIFKNFNEKKSSISNKYKVQIYNIKQDNSKSYLEKNQEIRLLKMDKVLELQSIFEIRKLEFDRLNNEFSFNPTRNYKKFLTERSTKDFRAVEELKRMETYFNSSENYINSVDSKKDFKLNISHKVTNDGVIVYKKETQTIIKDFGKNLQVVDKSEENILLSLQLAMQKYGANLNIGGSYEFRNKIIDVAIKNNLKITFNDFYSQERFNNLREMQNIVNKKDELKSIRSAWSEGFYPEIITHQNSNFKRMEHPDHDKAKNGDLSAAMRLAEDIISLESVEKLKEIAGDKKDIILVPVTAIEKQGANLIPYAMAEVISNLTNWEVAHNIKQINSPQRTNKDADYRMQNQPIFSGIIEKNKNYIIIDDHATLGATLTNLKGYIEQNGGNVIVATTLSASIKNLAPNEKTFAKIKSACGREFSEKYVNDFIKKETGYDFKYQELTRGELGYIAQRISYRRELEKIARENGQHAQVGSREIQESRVESKARGKVFQDKKVEDVQKPTKESLIFEVQKETASHLRPSLPEQIKINQYYGRQFLRKMGIDSNILDKAELCGFLKYDKDSVLFVSYDEKKTIRSIDKYSTIGTKDKLLDNSASIFPSVLKGKMDEVFIVANAMEAIILQNEYFKNNLEIPAVVVIKDEKSLLLSETKDLLAKANKIIVTHNEIDPEQFALIIEKKIEYKNLDLAINQGLLMQKDLNKNNNLDSYSFER